MAEKAVRAKITLHCSDAKLSQELRELLEGEGHYVVLKTPEKHRKAHARIHVERVYDIRGESKTLDFDAEGEFSKE